jgi:hypothetical protein
MNDILTIINELGINKQFMPIIYILLLIAIVYKPLMSFKHDIKRTRINKLKEAYDFNEHDENTKKYFKYSLSEEYFKLVTGLSFSFGQQEKLIELYLKNKTPVAFHHYKRVAEYFKFDDDQNIVSIEIPAFSQIIGYCQAILGFYLLGYVFLVLCNFSDVLKAFNAFNAFNGVLIVTGIGMLLGIVLFFGFICILNPYFIYKSSVHVNKQIGSADFTCFYHQALEKKKFSLSRKRMLVLRKQLRSLQKTLSLNTLRFLPRKPFCLRMRLLCFYLPIPALGFLLAYFQTTSA